MIHFSLAVIDGLLKSPALDFVKPGPQERQLASGIALTEGMVPQRRMNGLQMLPECTERLEQVGTGERLHAGDGSQKLTRTRPHWR